MAQTLYCGGIIMDQKLIDQVLAQIVEDVDMKDLTALEEMLKQVPKEALEGFLSEA